MGLDVGVVEIGYLERPTGAACGFRHRCARAGADAAHRVPRLSTPA